jgi:hypothetical protein
MGSSAGLVGAAMVAVESLFNPVCLKDWIVHGTPLSHPTFRTFKRLDVDHQMENSAIGSAGTAIPLRQI